MAIGVVPIRVVDGPANVVPVRIQAEPGIGIVNCTLAEGTANVVPVREAPDEIPYVPIYLVA